MNWLCPQCRKPLARVSPDSGMLNREQFDAIKAGDWYCNTCPANGRGKLPHCYWWDREVLCQFDQDERPDLAEFYKRVVRLRVLLETMQQEYPYTQNVAERVVRWAEDGFEGEP
jgi:hypothetical protein